MKIEKNRYDVLLTLMFWLMAAGQLGGFWQPVRVLMLLLIPAFLNDHISKAKRVQQEPLRETPSYRYETIFFILWWLYGFISLSWAIDLQESAKALFHLTVYFFGFGEVLWLAAKAKQPQKAILTGWILMFLTTLPIALHELITDDHLAMSVQDSGMTMKLGMHTHEVRQFASVTFGNLNSYNVVLCLTFCVMMALTLRENAFQRLLGFVMLVGIIALVVSNSSRAALICIALGLLIYVCILLRKRTHVFLLLTGIALALGMLIYYFSDLFSMILMRFQSQGLEDIGRLGVITHGLEELANSMGMGVGINNFSPIMENKYHLDITAPHNLWLEIGVQFGILILAGYIGMFIRAYKRAKTSERFNRFAAILCILPLLPISIIDSTYLLKATTWLYLATIYILSSQHYNDIQPTP